jgi:hypothetical protein
MSNNERPEDKTKIQLHMPEATGPLEVVRLSLLSLELDPQKVAGMDGYLVDLPESMFEGGLAQLVPEDRFLFHIDFREKAPGQSRHDAAEYIIRANYLILVGNFVMDLGTGVIRYRTSFDFRGGELKQEFVRNVIWASVDGATMFGKELINVIRGTKTPAAAFEDADSSESLQ